jgi:hypothetical protein
VYLQGLPQEEVLDHQTHPYLCINYQYSCMLEGNKH